MESLVVLSEGGGPTQQTYTHKQTETDITVVVSGLRYGASMELGKT